MKHSYEEFMKDYFTEQSLSKLIESITNQVSSFDYNVEYIRKYKNDKINQLHRELGTKRFYKVINFLKDILNDDILLWENELIQKRYEANSTNKEFLGNLDNVLNQLEAIQKRKNYIDLEFEFPKAIEKHLVDGDSHHKKHRMWLEFEKYLKTLPFYDFGGHFEFIKTDHYIQKTNDEKMEFWDNYVHDCFYLEIHFDILQKYLKDMKKDIHAAEREWTRGGEIWREEYISSELENMENQIKANCSLKSVEEYEKFKEGDGEGYVYIIREYKTNTYKVGSSRNLKSRSTNFDVKMPFEWDYIAILQTKNYKYLESLLHRKFKEHTVGGEWFSFNRYDLLDCYNSLKTHAQKQIKSNSSNSR